MEDRRGAHGWDDDLGDPRDTRQRPMIAGPGRSFTSRLDRWVAEARVDEAARARARERWLRSAAEQEATVAGVLVDLAERRAGVALSTTAGRRHRGSIGALGVDFVALKPASGPECLLALGAVSVVRTLPAEDPAAGDRAVTTALTLAEVLAELAAERDRVLVVTRAGSDSVAGELRSVGQDVVVLRADTDPPATAYVPLTAIAEVTLG